MSDDENNLNNKQELALELVLDGLTDAEIARRVGVSRQRVNIWRNQDEDFIYALKLRRKFIQEKHMHRLNSLIDKSIAIVRNALEEGDPATKLKAAMYVLRISGLQGYAKPGKETSKEEDEGEIMASALESVLRELGYTPDKWNF